MGRENPQPTAGYSQAFLRGQHVGENSWSYSVKELGLWKLKWLSSHSFLLWFRENSTNYSCQYFSFTLTIYGRPQFLEHLRTSFRAIFFKNYVYISFESFSNVVESILSVVMNVFSCTLFTSFQFSLVQFTCILQSLSLRQPPKLHKQFDRGSLPIPCTRSGLYPFLVCSSDWISEWIIWV